MKILTQIRRCIWKEDIGRQIDNETLNETSLSKEEARCHRECEGYNIHCKSYAGIKSENEK